MKTIIINCFFCMLAFLPALAQEKPSDDAEAFFKKAMSEINPRHVSWIKATAKKVNEKNMSESETRNMASQYAVLGNMNNSDMEALAFLVMMQASKDAQEDLEAIMADVKSINEQKKQVRDLQQDFEQHKKNVSKPGLDSIKLILKKQPVVHSVNTGIVVQPVKMVPTNAVREKQLTTVSPTVTKEEIGKAEQDIKDKLDTLSEMGETESLRLQMAMDRQSKMMTTLSNLLKKVSDSESSIIRNLK
ncbi:MAG: hypothetical protein ABI472_20285 [Ginsengibacter sp.]